MNRKKHPIWEVMPGAKNLRAFKANILPSFYIKNEVPESIRTNIDTIKKILYYSYYEYEFIDIALTHVIFTLEKALKLRYVDINDKPTKMRFADLIDWFHKKNYFETYTDEAAHQLRKIRNMRIHDETDHSGGSLFINKIQTAINLINDIHENVSLRIKRKLELEKWQKEIYSLADKGCIVTLGKTKIIAFQVAPIFINNKMKKKLLHILVWPIFDPKPYQNGKIKILRSIGLEIHNYQTLNGEVSGIIKSTKEHFKISTIKKDLNLKKYNEWKKITDTLQNKDAVFRTMEVPFVEYFKKSWINLHKQ